LKQESCDLTRPELELRGSWESYRAFLVRPTASIKSLVDDTRRFGIDAADIAERIGHLGSSLPKLLDEYHWVTITKGVLLPSRRQVANWFR